MTNRLFLALFLLCPLSIPNLFSEQYPKTNPAEKFSTFKLYDPSAANRPWRAAREDWATARQLAANDPAWQKWLATEREAINRWISRHRDHVEWTAGWSHDGISPKDGSRIRWNDKIPGEEIQFFSTPSDPQIQITPKLKAWWVVNFRNKHNDMMNRAAALGKLTRETRYAEWAASQLDFYADNFLHWKPQRKDQPARLYWQTLTEASNLVTYASTARLLRDHATPERLAKWRDKFFYPEAEAINSNFQNIHNIATWQRCAAAQVALLFDDQTLWRNALDGPFGLRAQIAQGITSDYIWQEQSLGYNSYVVKAVLTLFTAAGLHDRAETLGHEMAIAQNLMLSTTYMRFPDGYLPNPSDCDGRLKAPDAALFASAYRVFPTTLGLATAAKQRNWDTLLDPPAAIATARQFSLTDYKSRPPPLPAVASQNMESSRMAILCSGPWQVYFHYGQLTHTHTQSEALNYELYYNGSDLSHDTGTTGYGSPLHRGYYKRGANHNVPLIDGEGQENMPARGELLHYENTTGDAAGIQARVSARQPRYRDNASVTRTLTCENREYPIFTDTVVIDTTDGKKHSLGLALQLQGKLRPTPAFKPVATFAGNRPEPFKYWRHAQSADFTDRAELDIEYSPDLTMRVTLALKGPFRVHHGSTPDVPPRRRETLLVEQQGRNATITTTWKQSDKRSDGIPAAETKAEIKPQTYQINNYD